MVTDSSEKHQLFMFEQYGDYYRNYQFVQSHAGLDRLRPAIFRRKAKYIHYDSTTGRLLHLYDCQRTMCLLPGKVSTVLKQVHNKAGHFSTKVVIMES
jgi:hypothetical protein